MLPSLCWWSPYKRLSWKKQNQMCQFCCGNKKYNLTRNSEHIATDTEKWEYLQHIINKKIRTTDYPITPNIPNFLEFNGNLPYQLRSNDKATNEEVTLTSSSKNGNVTGKETNLPAINKTGNPHIQPDT